MKKIAYVAFATVAAISLAACGSSDSASEEAIAESVEMPADRFRGSRCPPASGGFFLPIV